MSNNKHNNQTTLMGCDTIEMNLVMKFLLMGYAQRENNFACRSKI